MKEIDDGKPLGIKVFGRRPGARAARRKTFGLALVPKLAVVLLRRVCWDDDVALY